MVLTNCSNNYGPWQLPEKLIPVVVLKAAAGEPIPLYGDGQISLGNEYAGRTVLIQSPSQAPLSRLSAWVEVGGIAPSLCLKAPPPQPIST